jgi:hypothetical protein
VHMSDAHVPHVLARLMSSVHVQLQPYPAGSCWPPVASCQVVHAVGYASVGWQDSKLYMHVCLPD